VHHVTRSQAIVAVACRPGFGMDDIGKELLPGWAAEIDCDNWAQFFLN
jgi:hypothetical protein